MCLKNGFIISGTEKYENPIFIYVLILDINSEFVGRLFSLPSSNSRLSSTTLSVHATSIACLMAFSTL